MRQHSLVFTAPRTLEHRHAEMGAPPENALLVETLVSAISPGTEMLIYRGEAPEALAADATISSLAGSLTFPLRYGYCLAGRVVEAPPALVEWRDRLVFSFHPHEDRFYALPEELIPIPEGYTPEQAVFLPNIETAVTFLLDARPLFGEQVLVCGQGVVGLLTTALLARMPLASLVTLDRYAERRAWSLRWGAHASLDPASPGIHTSAREALQGGRPYPGADLSFELSGAPAALDLAIALTGFTGRVVIGSWYGRKRADLDLGGAFHRSRMHLIASQVSTIDPALTGRWSPARRFDTVWRVIREIQPEQLITHRIPFSQADEAYHLIDKSPDQCMQVVLTY